MDSTWLSCLYHLLHTCHVSLYTLESDCRLSFLATDIPQRFILHLGVVVRQMFKCCIPSFVWIPDVWILREYISESALFHLHRRRKQEESQGWDRRVIYMGKVLDRNLHELNRRRGKSCISKWRNRVWKAKTPSEG